ncbi:MAG: hypothetical protein KIS30_03800 [Thermoplasmata archaeon]|nr:hypothetical protein [Candidatus Sysuiplasma acidicola]MBX8645868.1 hypothetical protein [Candidatus Sysuiplasma acidicola]
MVTLECRQCGMSFQNYEGWMLHGAVRHLSCPADNISFKSLDEAREHASSSHRISL